MRKIKSCIIILLLMLALVSCKSKEVDGDTYADMIISKEKMLSDYDSMWISIEKNFPFYGILNREGMSEEKYNEIKGKHRNEIESMELKGNDSMFKFVEVVAQSMYDVWGSKGHISIINPDFYKEKIEESTKDKVRDNILANPKVVKSYDYLDYLFESQLSKLEENNSKSEDLDNQQDELSAEQKNLTTKILRKGEIAYININSFGNIHMEKDLPKIRKFLEDVKDYKHLIIDIQNNGGGNQEYWEKALVCPNISEKSITKETRLIGNSELAEKFYYKSYEDSNLTIADVEKNPKFTKLNRDDLKNLSYAREIIGIYEPEFNDKLFKGEVWLLVGPQVASSAEGLAVYCKETNFATIVGETTGGANSGGPVLFELPNSHMLIQFDVEYVLNPDGSCNGEVGTEPDVYSKDNSALEACLEVIKSKE